MSCVNCLLSRNPPFVSRVRRLAGRGEALELKDRKTGPGDPAKDIGV